MTDKTINFQQQRELGDIITDTFKFIRENFKLLSKVIFKVCGPVFLIILFALGYYSYLGLDTFQNPFFGLGETGSSTMLIFSAFILISSLLAFYVLLYATVLHFIKSYVQNDGLVSETEVYQGVKNDFGGMLGILILTTIMAAAGTLLCILPGIYLWVPLSIAPAIMVFSGQSVFDSISYTFKLIKDNWWTTFFTLFVIGILVYIIGMVFQLPLIFYYFFKALTGSTEVSLANPSSLIDWVTTVINVIASLVQYLLTTIMIIATAFIYYNLDEKKNFTGSYKTISELGSSEDS